MYFELKENKPHGTKDDPFSICKRSFRNLQEQIFDKEGIKVRPVCTAEEIEVITGLVENGFGISVLPYMDIIRHHNIVAIPIQSLSEIGLFLAFQNNYFTAIELQHFFWTIGAVLIVQKYFFYRIFKFDGNGFTAEVGGDENAL